MTDAEKKFRRELAKLTPEALIDDLVGLRIALAESKAEIRKGKTENAAIKAQLADLTSDDKGTVIRRLSQKIRYLEQRVYQESDKFAHEKRKNYALNKRVKELEAASNFGGRDGT